MNEALGQKCAELRRTLASMESVAIAFSGGVDSAFLLKTAHDALGGRAVAVTALSPSFPPREAEAAAAFCREYGIRHETVETDKMRSPGFAENPPNRCYICKKALFAKIRRFADKNGFAEIAEGSNTDDDGDYRPGREAVLEAGVRSPLHEAGFTKADVREAAREAGLAIWNKPAMACLSSRFPYGEKLTAEKFARVDKAECFLAKVLEAAMAADAERAPVAARVRSQGDTARIEVPPEAFAAVTAHRREISDAFKKAGFAYVSLDLDGYRTGSMNEVL